MKKIHNINENDFTFQIYEWIINVKYLKELKKSKELKILMTQSSESKCSNSYTII